MLRQINSTSYFVNAKGIRNAKKRARFWLNRQGRVFGTVKKIVFNSWYKSKCDCYGDNYWFNVSVFIKE
jgi:hypothetical protein